MNTLEQLEYNELQEFKKVQKLTYCISIKGEANHFAKCW
jgi:hypothetical protein